MFFALFLADNLGFVQVKPLMIAACKEPACFVIDLQTERAWVIPICFTRIYAQMRR